MKKDFVDFKCKERNDMYKFNTNLFSFYAKIMRCANFLMRKIAHENLERYRESLGLVNSGEPQSGPDLKDQEEIDIASISTTNDRSKMDGSDGPPNSLNLTVRGIDQM
jgi:hypothetical protein